MTSSGQLKHHNLDKALRKIPQRHTVLHYTTSQMQICKYLPCSSSN